MICPHRLDEMIVARVAAAFARHDDDDDEVQVTRLEQQSVDPGSPLYLELPRELLTLERFEEILDEAAECLYERLHGHGYKTVSVTAANLYDNLVLSHLKGERLNQMCFMLYAAAK